MSIGRRHVGFLARAVGWFLCSSGITIVADPSQTNGPSYRLETGGKACRALISAHSATKPLHADRPTEGERIHQKPFLAECGLRDRLPKHR